MPTYDYQCRNCGKVIEEIMPMSQRKDTMNTYCDECDAVTECDQIITAPAFEDWGQGRHFEDLAPKGITFHSKGAYKKYLKTHGLREWTPKPGMPSNGRG